MTKPPHSFLLRRVWVTLWYDLPTRSILSWWLMNGFQSDWILKIYHSKSHFLLKINRYFWVVIEAKSALWKSCISHQESIVLVGKSYQSVTQTLLNKKLCSGLVIGSIREEILQKFWSSKCYREPLFSSMFWKGAIFARGPFLPGGSIVCVWCVVWSTWW